MNRRELWKVPNGRAIFETDADAETAKANGWKPIKEFTAEEKLRMYRQTQYVAKGQKPT